VAQAAARARPNARLLGLLALGHLVVDTNQGALPALLPFLKASFGLSYTAAGTVLLVANVTSSVVQPVFGYLSDRMARRWLLPWALVLASAGVALVGWAPSYAGLLVLVVAGGLGVAAYHPEGYKTANLAAGDRKGTGLSLFSLGGNIGIALGPPAVTFLVPSFGLRGTLVLMVPGLLVAALIAAVLPTLVARAPGRPTSVAGLRSGAATEMRGAMALLIGVVTIRSWTQLGLVAYVPFYYVDILKMDARVVGPLLFAFLGAGAVGTLLCGPVADRVGHRRYITCTLAAVTPLLALFLWQAGGLVSTVCLTLAGFILVSSFSITVALGQSYLPRRLGMAAGLIVGLAIGTGGVGVAVLGWIADHFGLLASLRLVVVLPLAGFVIALFLPEPRPVAPAA
jgi:FSR family fosmidomycin resistance protein-like MFS transporter